MIQNTAGKNKTKLDKKTFYNATIPGEWELKELGDCLDLLTDFEANGSFADVKANVRVFDEPKYAWYVRATDLENETNIDNVKYVDEKTYLFLKKTPLFGGEVLITKRGEIGKVYLFEKKTKWATVGPNLYLLKIKKEFNPYYIYCFFKAEIGNRELRRIDSSSTLGAIYKEDVKSIKLPLPPLPEQIRIANLLGTWDKAINNLQQTMDNLQLRKKWLMQQLLTGKKRLKGFDGKWRKIGAGEIFKSFSNKGFENEELLSATQDRGIIPRSLLEGRVTMPEGTTAGYKLVEPGDFVISLRSFQGGLEYSYCRGIVSPAYIVLKPKEEINDEFYKQYYKSYEFIGRLATAVIGIRDGKQISYDDYCLVKIPYPTIKEQTAIAQVLQIADKEITLHKIKLDKLKEEKEGLMQLLLTGKKRV